MASHTLTYTPDNTGRFPTPITSVVVTCASGITSQAQMIAAVHAFLGNVVNGTTHGGAAYT